MASIALQHLTIPRSTALSGMLGLALLTSSVVFSEPAPVDVLMAGFILALCLMGGGRIGATTTINIACWLLVLAFSFVAVSLSPSFEKALVHQVVTAFLVVGAVAIAAYVAEDPVPRVKLILNCYVVGIAIACLLAYIGYFELVPGAYDLFTNYGRARGSYKDPNVFGAALAPALAYLCWLLLRNPAHRARVPALLFLFMAPALIISFSRGAWISFAVSMLIILFIAITRTRRRSDHVRMLVYAFVGTVILTASLAAILQ
ncbi:MAG: hypothetical protein KKB37_06760, partial [Alphaproteobacteria bacterium]|nr:hypothetical protein [Alphaproteobacteria bacterium]